MLLVGLVQDLAGLVFLGSIAGVSLHKLVLALAFHALHNVHHADDRFFLHLLILLLPQKTLIKPCSTLS